MESFEVVEHIINTFGFPILMVFYFIWDKTKLTDKLTKAIENNNSILTRLLDKLDLSELKEEENE